MERLSDSFKRPFTNFSRLIIGIIFSIFPVVNFFVFGYELKCSNSAMKKKSELPKWEKFGELFVTGFMSLVIQVIYFLPALILFFAAAASVFVDMIQGYVANGTMDWTLLNLGTGIGFVILGLVLFLLGGLIGVSGVVNYSKRYKFSDAFSGEVFRKAFRGQFLGLLILVVLYGMLLSMLLSWIPFVGSAIVAFISGVTIMTALGRVYNKL